MKNNIKILSARFGRIIPDSVKEYVSEGGYQGLKKAIELEPLEVIEEVKKAKLFGRGGAAYPAGLKWEQAYNIKRFPKYIVCNADEGEPGTFKDRLVLSDDPLQLIEGMTIAAYVMGATEGYIYIRGEYSKIQETVRSAINNAKSEGYLGKNILGKGFDFDIKVVSGAGAYVCGENTALVESIEGKTGRPRMKPPFIKNVGLNQMPTLLNNVETFSCIPWIVKDGGETFANLGTEHSGGTKLVSISGNVANKGVFEVPFGTTVREIIYELGGGVPNGRELKIVHMGGFSGKCFPEKLLDTKVCYNDLKTNGLTLGSGAITVIDDTNCPVDYLKVVMDFFQEESCGKCTPCREGNQKILELLQKLSDGRGTSVDVDKILSLSRTMQKTSFCGLGQSSPNPIVSMFEHFKDEILEHVEGKCPTGRCSMNCKEVK